MPKILIVGATGYIGQILALSLLRSGNHVVYGIARSELKARSLAQLESIPILCPDLVADPTPLVEAIHNENISVVVACGADIGAAKLLEAVVAAGKQRVDAYATESLTCPKLGFVYTSGTWVHGSSLQPITDLDPVSSEMSPTQPPSLIAWRSALEQQVLKSRDVLDVIVIRPALIYGRSHAIWKTFFNPVLEATKTNALTVKVRHTLARNLCNGTWAAQSWAETSRIWEAAQLARGLSNESIIFLELLDMQDPPRSFCSAILKRFYKTRSLLETPQTRRTDGSTSLPH
jgi:nucleoside-diphosphate-sugar epimerase